MNKVNIENSFQSFYYNYYDVKLREGCFELDGLQYPFTNVHEEKNEKVNLNLKNSSSLSSSIGLRMYENSTSLTQNLNVSNSSPKKSFS